MHKIKYARNTNSASILTHPLWK